MMTLASVDLVGVRCCLLVLVLVLSDIFFSFWPMASIGFLGSPGGRQKSVVI